MFLKKVGSFALILGTLGSFACQSVSGVQGDLQKKASVVNAGKQNENSGKIGKDVAKKAVVQKGSAAIGQNKDQQKKLETILFGEYSDLLLNYLSKAFGVHEHWKSLFETYEGDPYKAAKYALAFCLLCFRLYYMFIAFRQMKCYFVKYNLRHVVNFRQSWGKFFSPGANLFHKKRTLFNLYFYNISISAYILRALCPTVFIPHFVHFSVDNAEIKKLRDRLIECEFELGMRKYCEESYDLLEKCSSNKQLLEEIENIKKQLSNKEVDVRLLMQDLDIVVKEKILREGKKIIETLKDNENGMEGSPHDVTKGKAEKMVNDMTEALIKEGISGVDNI